MLLYNSWKKRLWVCDRPLSLRSMGRETFSWLSAEPPETTGNLGCGGELVLLRLEFPFEAWPFTGRFTYMSKLDEVTLVNFLPFNLPLTQKAAKETSSQVLTDGIDVNKQMTFGTADTCLFAFQDTAALTLFCLLDPLHLLWNKKILPILRFLEFDVWKFVTMYYV